MVTRLAAFFVALSLLVPAVATASNDRGLLWRVVQVCLATHRLTGSPFPCLDVDVAHGAEEGYAVVRAPFEATHVVVTPTVRTVGIESARLRADDAPNYFADAWQARHYVAEALPHRPDRTDLALAVNSRPGRSQDQLHIHVDCIRTDVKRSLAARMDEIRSDGWTRISILPRAPRYQATTLVDPDLQSTNIFNLVKTGLHVDADHMDEVTIVVVGAKPQGKPGFVVLARRRIPDSRDEAHGEALLDHSCSALQ